MKTNILKNLMEGIPYYIFWKDSESRYLGCNDQFAKLVGKASPSEVIGKTERNLVVWEHREPFNFMGNPVLFYRIIFNLIKNALYQIHKQGKSQIFIKTEVGEDYNMIRFKDTAGGVTPMLIEKLFEGFNSTKEEGIGVGLAFCKYTLQSFGGDIAADIVEGDDIEFVVRLPRST